MKRFVLTLSITTCFGLTNCGKDGGDSIKKTDLEDLAVTMPANTEETKLLKVEDLTPGRYKLVQIRSYFSGTEHNIKAGFEQSLAEPGDLDDADKVRYSVDLGTLDRDNESYYITHELNVPQELEIKDKNAEFSHNRYYWNQIRGQDEWSWAASGDQSSRGARFHELFTEGKATKGVYRADELNLYSDEDDSFGSIVSEDTTIHFFFAIEHEDRLRVNRISYQR